MKLSSTVSLLLALLLSANIVSCGTGTQHGANTSGSDDVTTEPESTTEPVDPASVLELPDSDFKGREFRVLGNEGAYPQWNNFEIYAESENGDVVNDAVFRRNRTVEDRYNVKVTQIIQNSGADMAINIRWQIWLESLRLFVQRPLVGYGAGTHTTWELLKQQNLPVVHTHNLALQLLVEGGLIALAIMLCLGLKTVKSGLVLMRKNRKPRSFWLGYALIGFSVAFCVQGMFDFPLMTPKLVCHFVMILALAERATVLFDIRPFSVRTQLKKRWDSGRRKRKISEKQKSGG